MSLISAPSRGCRESPVPLRRPLVHSRRSPGESGRFPVRPDHESFRGDRGVGVPVVRSPSRGPATRGDRPRRTLRSSGALSFLAQLDRQAMDACLMIRAARLMVAAPEAVLQYLLGVVLLLPRQRASPFRGTIGG